MSFERNIRAPNREILSLSKNKGSEEVEIFLLVDKQKMNLPPHFVERRITEAINEIIFAPLFPTPFIASAERTGAAIFRKELNFARNRLLKEMSQADDKIDPRELLHTSLTRTIHYLLKKTLISHANLRTLPSKKVFSPTSIPKC